MVNLNDTVAIVPVRAFRDNYIWVLRRGGHAAAVDPGDAAPLCAWLDAEGLRLDAVLVTHHHADHTGGLGDLARRYAPTVFGPAAESITGVSSPLAGGETIRVPGIELDFDVLAVPGHTRGHLAYLGRGAAGGTLFCGDTLFGAGCGRLFEGTPAQMFASLARILALPPTTQIYSAHEYTAQNLRFAQIVEPQNAAVRARADEVAQRLAAGIPSVPFTLAEELETNPFLRCEAAAVVAAAVARGAAPQAAAVFAEIRRWRDEY